jgi:hypothetical protein
VVFVFIIFSLGGAGRLFVLNANRTYSPIRTKMEIEEKRVPNFGTISKCDALISLPSLFFLDHAHTHSTTTLTHNMAAQEIDTRSYHNGCHPPPPPPSPHQLKTSQNMTNIHIEAIDSVQYHHHHHTQNSHNMVQTWKLWVPSI